MIRDRVANVSSRTSFSVAKKKPITFKPITDEHKRYVKFFSGVITENFSMSEELAKAIGTVVVQALTENAKTESQDVFGDTNSDDDLDLDLGDDVDLDESELPESSRDSGKVQEAEGPKNAPDLSADFAELKGTMSNHSELQHFAEDRYKAIKEYLSYRSF